MLHNHQSLHTLQIIILGKGGKIWDHLRIQIPYFAQGEGVVTERFHKILQLHGGSEYTKILIWITMGLGSTVQQ